MLSAGLFFAGLLAAFGPSQAHAQAGEVRVSAPVVNIDATGDRISAAGARVTIGGNAESIRAAGGTVTITGTITNDVTAIGAAVSVDATVVGGLTAAGGSVNVKGDVGDRIEAAGAVVVIDAATAGRVRAGGATVTIGPDTNIRGQLEVGGAVVHVAGHVGGSVDVNGAVVTFEAQTDGSVTIRGQDITIGPATRIGGDLTVQSPADPTIADGAVVSGVVHKVAPPRWWAVVPPWGWTLVFGIAMALGTILTGIVLLLFGGRLFAAATDHVRLRPGSSLILGIATVILIPVIAGLLVATVIGLTAGLAVLFVLPLLIVFGHAVAAAGIAAGIFVRERRPLGGLRALALLVIGAIVIALVGIVPWVGPPLVFVAILLGTGALTRTIGARLRRPEPDAA